MQNQNTTRCLIAALGFLVTASLSAASGSRTDPGKLTLDEEKAIRATIEAYRTAWLANDSKAVLRTFTDDAVVAQGWVLRILGLPRMSVWRSSGSDCSSLRSP
jgi:hypothetical protein